MAGAGLGKSGLQGRGAGMVPFGGFGLREKGKKREGRAALYRVGGQLPPALTCWEGWGSVTTASLHFHARSEKGVDSVSFPSLV